MKVVHTRSVELPPLAYPEETVPTHTSDFSKLVTELTRQNGHAPPPIESRKIFNQSSLCPDLVSFPVLSQIKPQAPLLVVPFRQFL